jgi:mannosyltransferase OCH1-like enzyme
MKTQEIPKRFVRIWLGQAEIPSDFQDWWEDFKTIHPDYEFITLGDDHGIEIPDYLQEIYDTVDSYAGRSDILRLVYLQQQGGIYVDTDIMPLKSFEPLRQLGQPFLAKRSGKSFESAVIGSPANHRSFDVLLRKLPEWYDENKTRAASVKTGPAFISSVLFGRNDVAHLPSKYFYPFNGFMAPKRDEKTKMFEEKNFSEEMYCAHFSNHRWGGNPNKRKKA